MVAAFAPTPKRYSWQITNSYPGFCHYTRWGVGTLLHLGSDDPYLLLVLALPISVGDLADLGASRKIIWAMPSLA